MRAVCQHWLQSTPLNPSDYERMYFNMPSAAVQMAPYEEIVKLVSPDKEVHPCYACKRFLPLNFFSYDQRIKFPCPDVGPRHSTSQPFPVFCARCGWQKGLHRGRIALHAPSDEEEAYMCTQCFQAPASSQIAMVGSGVRDVCGECRDVMDKEFEEGLICSMAYLGRVGSYFDAADSLVFLLGM